MSLPIRPARRLDSGSQKQVGGSGTTFLAGLALLRYECGGDPCSDEPGQRRGKEYHGAESVLARKQADQVEAGFNIEKDIDADPEQEPKQRTPHIGMSDKEQLPFIKLEKKKQGEKAGNQSE